MNTIIISHPNEVVLVRHAAGDASQVTETSEGDRLYKWAQENGQEYVDAFNTQWLRQQVDFPYIVADFPHIVEN